MYAIALLVSWAAVAVDYGWQPTQDGQLEYIVQIAPAELDAMKNGEEIISEIHPDARGVRRFRIRVGRGELPRVGHVPPDSGSAAADGAARGAPATGSVLPPNLSGPALEQGGRSDAATASGSSISSDSRPGILDLPPPPSDWDDDGKNSVLVRPGPRQSAAAPAPGRGQAALTDSPGGEIASGRGGILNLPPPPDDDSDPPEDTLAGPRLDPLGDTPNRSFDPAPFPRGSSFPTFPGTLGNAVAQNQTPSFPIPSLELGGSAPAPDSGAGDASTGTPAAEPESTATASRSAGEGVPSADDSNEPDSLLAGTSGAAFRKPELDGELADLSPERPWLPLVLTSLALFASLAANFYLGWVAMGIYRRYRELVVQLQQARQAAPA